jgi:hypothetical protein
MGKALAKAKVHNWGLFAGGIIFLIGGIIALGIGIKTHDDGMIWIAGVCSIWFGFGMAIAGCMDSEIIF